MKEGIGEKRREEERRNEKRRGEERRGEERREEKRREEKRGEEKRRGEDCIDIEEASSGSIGIVSRLCDISRIDLN